MENIFAKRLQFIYNQWAASQLGIVQETSIKADEVAYLFQPDATPDSSQLIQLSRFFKVSSNYFFEPDDLEAERMMKVWRILLDRKRQGDKDGVGYITEAGAKIIWAAYKSMNRGGCQTMERRESRGGVCWLSEIKYWKDTGHLDKDFDWTDYMVCQIDF